MTRPNVGFVIGVTIGLVRPLYALFYGDGAPFSFITDVLELLGDPTVPVATLILGIKMAHFWEARQAGTDTQTKAVPRSLIVSALLIKLIILPTIVILCLAAASAAGLLPTDPLIPVVLVLQAATPMPTNTIILGELYGHSQGLISSLQIISYLLSFFTVILFTAISLAWFV